MIFRKFSLLKDSLFEIFRVGENISPQKDPNRDAFQYIPSKKKMQAAPVRYIEKSVIVQHSAIFFTLLVMTIRLWYNITVDNICLDAK